MFENNDLNKIEFKQFHIKNFRGIRDLKWNPQSGMNVIIGGGDCGKTTILESIGLLLSPTNNKTLSESDFWNKNINDGFSIEGVIQVSENFDFSSGKSIYWPWIWDGNNAVVPDAEQDLAIDVESQVYKVIVNAKNDFDLTWEIIQPDDSRENFPVGLRRKLGLVELSADNFNDRDLRLVYGSSLDRLISDNTLRSKISHVISQIPLMSSLSEPAKIYLGELDQALKTAQLPNGLDLGIVSSQGISIGSLIGLLANKGGVSLPLTSWGEGTRRMATLQVSSTKDTEAVVTTIDEIERGLEPYRLRQFIKSLIDSDSQSFITTHSPITISCTENAQLWYLDSEGTLGSLDRASINTQQQRDPETFLSKVSVIVEGETEMGFVNTILSSIFGGNHLDAGIKVCLGQGDDQLLSLLKSLNESGIKFAGFADNDGKKPGSWEALKTGMKDRLFRWETGCTETNILGLIPDAYLPEILKDVDTDWDGNRLRTLATRLDISGAKFEDIQQSLKEKGKSLKALIIEAATGNTDGIEDKSTKKSWKGHAHHWFKKADGSGGVELLNHLKKAEKWNDIEPLVRPFFNSVLNLSGRPDIPKINL